MLHCIRTKGTIGLFTFYVCVCLTSKLIISAVGWRKRGWVHYFVRLAVQSIKGNAGFMTKCDNLPREIEYSPAEQQGHELFGHFNVCGLHNIVPRLSYYLLQL